MAEISPLRRRIIEDMTVRNLSPATQQSYLNAVAKLSRYFGRSHDRLDHGIVIGRRADRGRRREDRSRKRRRLRARARGRCSPGAASRDRLGSRVCAGVRHSARLRPAVAGRWRSGDRLAMAAPPACCSR